MALSSNRYIRRSFCDIRFDQSPERLCLSGSVFPRPEDGSSDRSISFSSLHKALCNRLSFSRMASYACQVLPSNTSDLIHLLVSRFITFPTVVGFKGRRNLLHQALTLENVKGFLFSLPVLSAHHHESFSGSARNLDRFMLTNYLLNNIFQVISKLIHADCVHKTPLCTDIPYNYTSQALTQSLGSF